MYLYTNQEDPLARPQYFNTDFPVSPWHMNNNINENIDAPKYKSKEKRSVFLQVDNLFIFVPALVSIMMRFVTALDNSLGLNYKQLGDWILTIENKK